MGPFRASCILRCDTVSQLSWCLSRARRSATLPFWEFCLQIIDPRECASLPPTTTTGPTDNDDGPTVWPTKTASAASLHEVLALPLSAVTQGYATFDSRIALLDDGSEDLTRRQGDRERHLDIDLPPSPAQPASAHDGGQRAAMAGKPRVTALPRLWPGRGRRARRPPHSPALHPRSHPARPRAQSSLLPTPVPPAPHPHPLHHRTPSYTGPLATGTPEDLIVLR
ncbi:hypothetical protein GGX14DRAFT_557404 [Mycena pura]|uniref:Uncharacterized protein n=1 Tax=Mycena pura TaxID=153505 RepID=A0AAD7E2F4_9AGAR|nr:hypothetical protein GGX14DRAFT_557404 [Mycena pura]